MTTLIDVRKEVNVCDEATVKNIYTTITLRLTEIMHAIKKHEHDFSSYLIKQHPVANTTSLITTEIDALQKLPDSAAIIKKHGDELSLKLREFKHLIGTPFCNKPHQAYDLFTTHVVQPFMKHVKHDLNMPELTLHLSQLKEDLITASARTPQQKLP